VQFFCII